MELELRNEGENTKKQNQWVSRRELVD